MDVHVRSPAANLGHVARASAARRGCPSAGDSNVAGVERDVLLFELIEGPGKGLRVDRWPQNSRVAGIEGAEGASIPVQHPLNCATFNDRSRQRRGHVTGTVTAAGTVAGAG